MFFFYYLPSFGMWFSTCFLQTRKKRLRFEKRKKSPLRKAEHKSENKAAGSMKRFLNLKRVLV